MAIVLTKINLAPVSNKVRSFEDELLDMFGYTDVYPRKTGLTPCEVSGVAVEDPGPEAEPEETVYRPSAAPGIEALNERLNFNFPKIVNVIYNDPVTIVFFEDGTKVKVKAQAGVPFTKEGGLVYALLKRLVCIPDIDGNEVMGNGFGNILEKAANAGFDQKEHLAKRKAEANAKKRAKKAKEAEGPAGNTATATVAAPPKVSPKPLAETVKEAIQSANAPKEIAVQ